VRGYPRPLGRSNLQLWQERFRDVRLWTGTED